MSWHTNLTWNVSHNIFDNIAFILVYSTLFCKFIWSPLCFSAWSFTIPFNAPSPMLPEKLFADPNFSMLCGILAKACILGKFHPQPSSLGKHSFIRSMRMPRAAKDHLICDLWCGSLTQHSNDKYSFRQFLNFSMRLSHLSFPYTSTFTLNKCAWHKITQSSYQLVWIRTFWYHQIFHFLLTCAESLSHFVALHPLLNNIVNHQMIPYLFFWNWCLQSNYQDNQTCVWVSQCHWHVTFLQEQILVIPTSSHQKGHSQKRWKCFFA